MTYICLKLKDMSTLLKDKISGDMKTAMKNRDVFTRDTLRVLMGEIDRGQLTKDDDIVPVVKKMIDNIRDTGSNTAEAEILVLEKYMPRQLSEAELDNLVDDLIKEKGYSSMRDMGAIMGHFSKSYPSQYDGGLLSSMVKAKFIVNG
jgi:uncharacterized protein